MAAIWWCVDITEIKTRSIYVLDIDASGRIESNSSARNDHVSFSKASRQADRQAGGQVRQEDR